ncbi:MAG: SseB family protein [Paracoccaceae bacterium]
MTEPTPLDMAHRAMMADQEDANARIAFYQCLADAEIIMLLDAEPGSETVSPRLFDVEGSKVALIFDRDDRLAEFAKTSAPYAAMSGRALVGMLAGREIGLGLNLGVAPSSYLVPSGAVDWLADALNRSATEITEQPTEITPPTGIPGSLVQALQTKLQVTAKLLSAAYLVKAVYTSGKSTYLLTVLDAAAKSQAAIAQSINEVVIFADEDVGGIDVAFFTATDPIVARLIKHGFRFDLSHAVVSPKTPKAPGMDPDAPPRLR